MLKKVWENSKAGFSPLIRENGGQFEHIQKLLQIYETHSGMKKFPTKKPVCSY